MKPESDWQEFYDAALLETDDGKLVQRVRAAKAAIDSRLEVLQLDHGGTPEERHAIADALAGLNNLRNELEIRAHDACSSNANRPTRDSYPKVSCSLCNKPLTLLPTDTTSDEHGKPVHPGCYFKNLTGRKLESPSAGTKNRMESADLM
jgi:hypothetical protein